MLADTFVSPHALLRVRQHHPCAGVRGTLAMVGRAVEIEQGTAAGLLCRQMSACLDRYLLAYDRRGVFVVAPSRGDRYRWAVITYIRLGGEQRSLAERLWPVDAAPSDGESVSPTP